MQKEEMPMCRARKGSGRAGKSSSQNLLTYKEPLNRVLQRKAAEMKVGERPHRQQEPEK